MGLPLSTLIKSASVDEMNATLLALLQAEGFPTTAWQDGTVPLTLANSAAEVESDLSALIALLAQAGFAVLAAAMTDENGVEIPDWLDLISVNFFQETRATAQTTVGTIVLTDTSGSPTTISIGQLWAQTPEGKRFNNTTGGTLAANGTLSLSWQAESPGSSYNVPNNTITQLATPIPGISVNNPPGTGTWITTSGTDAQSNASLLQQCLTKWASLGTGSNRDAYVYWAKKVAPTITRVYPQTDNPFGPGTVRLWVANDAGIATSGELAAIRDYIGALLASDPTKGVKPETVTVDVQSATTVPITLTATIHVVAASLTTAQTKANDQVIAYTKTLMGGLQGADKVDQGLLFAKLFSSGVTEVDISSPAADVALTIGQVPIVTLNLTWISV